MNLVFSTSAVPPEDRVTALREAVCQRFIPLDVAPIGTAARDGRFLGDVSARSFDGLRIARFCGSPVFAERTSRHIAESADDDYLVALHTRGLARVSQAGRSAILGPGDLALLDSARPYSIELRNAGAFEHIAYQVPRAALDARTEGLTRALSLPLRAGSDAGALASQYLRTLASPTWRTPAHAAAPLVETGLDLLVAALAGAAGLHAAGSCEQTQMLGMIKRHVLARLGDPEISPVTVAQAHFISTRQLHRLFAREGASFGAWTREQRLRRCRAALADGRLSDITIGEIASRWGYRSAAHFSRAFASRYGIGPRDFRRAQITISCASKPPSG
ncbi:MAG TPA: helix-turn-helix domain-containing protein [Solirubrobacteraceae bacterium]|jgi:AraC-like DNA-binding protein